MMWTRYAMGKFFVWLCGVLVLVYSCGIRSVGTKEVIAQERLGTPTPPPTSRDMGEGTRSRGRGDQGEAPTIEILQPPLSPEGMATYQGPSIRIVGEAFVTGTWIDSITVGGKSAHFPGTRKLAPGELVRFDREVPLNPGSNVVEIVVMDKKGRSSKRVITIERPSGPAPPAPQGETYVLLVGINEYKDPDIPDLRFAENDAGSMYAFFKEITKEKNIRFLRGQEATKRNILRAFFEHLVRKAVNPEDRAIFYYAGHGTTGSHPVKGTEYYLIPADGVMSDLFATGIVRDELVRYWSAVTAKQKIFISDACHSGGFRGIGLEKIPGQGNIVFTAAQPNQFSLEIPSLGHGIFTYALLEGLVGKADEPGYGDRNGAIALSELKTYLADAVPRMAQRIGGTQNPVVEENDVVGDLVLARPRPGAVFPPPVFPPSPPPPPPPLPPSPNINWEAQIVQATGIGAINPKLPRPAQRAAALRAARMDALRNLIETIQGVHVTSRTTVREQMLESDVVRSKVEGWARNFRQVGPPRYLSDGTVEVDYAMPVNDPLRDALIPSSEEEGYSLAGEPPPATAHYTGLIVDTKGLHIQPALSPRIMDQRRREVYGPSFVDREYAIEIGVVGYAKSLEQAKADPRVGDHPLIVKAIKTGPQRVDVIIADTDAEVIHQVVENGDFLKECRVMFLVD